MTQPQIFKLSVSKTSTFQGCKAKYKFSYIQKLPRKSWDFHTFGRFLHKILEDFHLAYINGCEDSFPTTMTKFFKEAFYSSEFAGKVSTSAKKEAFEILVAYLKQISKNKEDINKVIAVEKSFNLQINDSLILNGMIDRVQIDNDGIIHICDYKTTKNKAYLKNDDSLQLLTYAYVMLQENPEITKIRGSYILLRHNFEYITKEFSLEEIKNVKNMYEGYANSIHQETQFEANPTKLCGFCDFLGICSSGSAFIGKQYKTGATKY